MWRRKMAKKRKSIFDSPEYSRVECRKEKFPMPPFTRTPQKKQKLVIWGTQIQGTLRLWVIATGELFPQLCQSCPRFSRADWVSWGTDSGGETFTSKSPQVPTKCPAPQSCIGVTESRNLGKPKICLFVFSKWKANSRGIKICPEQRWGDL